MVDPMFNAPTNANVPTKVFISEAGTYTVRTFHDAIAATNPADEDFSPVNLQLPTAEEANKPLRICYAGETFCQVLAAPGDLIFCSDGATHQGNVLTINGAGGNLSLLPIRVDETQYGWSVVHGGRSITVSTV